MIYLHEVWLNGSSEPQRLRLESDQLFQAYQRWIQDDATVKERGLVFTYKDKETTKTIALIFSGVSCITIEKIDDASERRAMGLLGHR